jgi:hypothetical protein
MSLSVSDKPVECVGQYDARMKMRIPLLLAGPLLFTLLQGCMVDRLLAVRSQMCTFDEAYRVSLFPALEIDMLEPVMLDEDIHWLWDAEPTVYVDDGRERWDRYVLQKLVIDEEGQRRPMADEISIDFEYTLIDGQNLLSRIRTSDLPAGLRMEERFTPANMQDMAHEVCNTSLAALMPGRKMPLDPGLLEDLPNRTEVLDALGPPTEVLSDNDALVYEYRLSGSEEPRHVARLVVQFDPEGVRPLQVESVYGRYRSVTDLEATSTRIYIK